MKSIKVLTVELRHSSSRTVRVLLTQVLRNSNFYAPDIWLIKDDVVELADVIST